MKVGDRSVSQILVGVNRVGITGLRGALAAADDSGLGDREAIVDVMMRTLEPLNYIPESLRALYRTAFWREYLRHRGEPFDAFLSEVPVVVRGTAGPERDQFLGIASSVLRELELRPIVTFEDSGASRSELAVQGEVIARSTDGRSAIESSIRRSFSDW